MTNVLPFGRLGYVYFAKQRGGHYVKIGFTTKPETRGLGTYLIEILALFGPVGPEAETELHERFAHLRVRGEWFRPEPDLLSVIGRVVTGHPPLISCVGCQERVLAPCELPQCYLRYAENTIDMREVTFRAKLREAGA